MKIELTICDHCETIITGLGGETYRLGGGTVDFDICSECQSKPFKSLAGSSEKGRDIDAFIRRLATSQHPHIPKERDPKRKYSKRKPPSHV